MNETTYSLVVPENFHIADNSGRIWFGCDQEWFTTYWQRLAGCGPCVASNLLFYLHKRKYLSLPIEVESREDFIRVMEMVWYYVTPTVRGLNTPELMCKGAEAFAAAHGFKIKCRSLPIPKKQDERPEFSDVENFILGGLSKDLPVAFLNLSNGAVHDLDSWHWVTVVSVVQGGDGSCLAKVYDGSQELTVDLKLWYETTTLGGGFVYFNSEP